MSKKSTTLLIMMLCIINLINAQNPYCGMDAIAERVYNDPVLLQKYLDKQNPYTESELNRIDCTNGIVDIPLAFHFSSEFNCESSACMLTEIDDAINTLNINFGDNTDSPAYNDCPSAYQDNLGNSVISTGVCVNFYLAAAPDCSNLNPCDGAITIGQFEGSYRGGGNGAGECWDDYLNIFIGSISNGNPAGVSDQIPGTDINAPGLGEGISIQPYVFGGTDGPCGPFDGRGTGDILTHEVGHYLGCPHIWGILFGNCSSMLPFDDGFADTPDQDQPFDFFSTLPCPASCVASGCGGFQQTANFMNYSSCQDLFKEDQADAMYFYANEIFGNLNIPAVDPATCAENICCVDLNLEIMFDKFPEQTSWDITDAAGNVVASGGPYPNEPDNSTLNITLSGCLDDGCYDLNFYDSLGNGMCPFQQNTLAVGTFITPGTAITPGTIVGTFGNVVTPGLCGNYELTDANGTSLASGGGKFGQQESNQFCLENGVFMPRLGIGIENEYHIKVDILPNPASDFMTIRHNMNNDVDIKIIDLYGKTVLASAMDQMELFTYRVDVGNLNTGVYMIYLESAENTAVKKFIKK